MLARMWNVIQNCIRVLEEERARAQLRQDLQGGVFWDTGMEALYITKVTSLHEMCASVSGFRQWYDIPSGDDEEMRPADNGESW